MTSKVTIVKTDSAHVPSGTTKVVNSDSWDYTWHNLDKYRRVVGETVTFDVYEYTIKETEFVYDGVTYIVGTDGTVTADTAATGFDAEKVHKFLTSKAVTGTNTAITNTLNETHLDVNKKWWSMDGTTAYSGSLDGKSITLTLYRIKTRVSGTPAEETPTYDYTTFTLDGEVDETAKTLATLTGTAKETARWVARFDGLPLAGVEDGVTYSYSYYVTEAQVSGFDAAVYTEVDTTAFPTVDQQKTPSTQLVVTDRSGKTVYIHNKQMQTVALPATGGPGTTLYYIAGASLLLLALALLLRKKQNYD